MIDNYNAKFKNEQKNTSEIITTVSKATFYWD